MAAGTADGGVYVDYIATAIVHQKTGRNLDHAGFETGQRPAAEDAENCPALRPEHPLVILKHLQDDESDDNEVGREISATCA